MADAKYRLVTRSDFDGVVCGVLFREMDMIDGIKFVHPKDMQDGTVLVADTDISTNLPYVKGVHLAFDHHASEIKRLGSLPRNYIVDPNAPSAARVVYRYYGGAERFPRVSEDMMAAVDKSDSGQLTETDILRPKGWVQLNYLLDARTGLGRYRSFRIYRGRDAGYPAPPAQIRTCPLRHPAPPLGWTDGESAVRPRVSDFQPGPMGSGQSRDVSPCGAVLLRPAA